MKESLLPSSELSSATSIENCIYEIRGKQVMLDSDIAVLFQVEPKYLNRQMKRNQDRFPNDFCFQLNSEEFKNLRFQNVTFNSSTKGRKYLPHVYTEEGILVLAGVLRSDVATKMSVEIARVFVRMRKYFLSNKDYLITKSEFIEFKDDTNKKIDQIINKIEKVDLPKSKLFFDGEWFDAYEYIVNIIKRAKQSVLLIDPYLDDKALSYLSHKNTGVVITLVYSNKSKLNAEEINRFISQYGEIITIKKNNIHDRFLVIDSHECYSLGSSLNHIGNKIFLLNKIENQEIVDTIIMVLNG